MSRHRWAVLPLAFLSCGALLHAQSTVSPPVAKQVAHCATRHGEVVVDQYHWLREKSNPEVLAYLNAENAYTEAMTDGLRDLQETIYCEMVARVKQTDLSLPMRRRDYYYYARTVEGQQYPIQCRKRGTMDAEEEILLDANELAQGHAFFAVGTSAVSDDHALMAYTTDTTGFRQYTLHVKDLASGKLLGDTAQRVTSLTWAADHRTLFYVVEDPQTKRPHQLYRLELGAPAELIYEETDALFRMRIGRTNDRRYLTLHMGCEDTSETRYLPADSPRGEFRTLYARQPGHRYRLEHRAGKFYIWTNRDAKNYRVVTAPADDPCPENWRELVPHRPDVLVQGVEAYRDFLVVAEKSNALNGLRVYDFRTGQWQSLEFPEPVYAAYGSFGADFEEDFFHYSYQSLVTPPSIFQYDVAFRRSTLVKQEEILGGYDSAAYESQRMWVTARDGAQVPLSIVYKKGFRRDGSQPLLLYAYGSYGNGMSASFSSDRISLLDRGMAFAIAHVRGGNELGEAWREDGSLMKKKNTFNDFIDCAEHLVRHGWTSPERLAIEGASAGGLLMGAVVNMRPDLFRAVHAAVPFVDVMNTMFDPSLPLTVGEYLVWGNPQDKAAYDYMKSYSPYDNLAQHDYPAMLVTTSLNDSQVMYWEPAKYVARLRTLKTDSRPLLLKTNMHGGHGGSSGRYDRLREQAFYYAWLLDQVSARR